MENILGTIRSEVKDFNDTSVEVVSGYMHNQAATLKRIELYYNSRFETGEKDSEGFRKFFYNVVHFPCQVATKNIDLDVKDFRLIPETAEAQIPTLFLQKELKDWMKEQGFGETLNEVSESLPKYGSVVVKKIKDELEVVNLHNLVNDQSVDCLEDSPYVLERHVMTPTELRKMARKGAWDSDVVEEVIALYQKDTRKNEIIVWERWGWVEDEYKLYICAGVEKVQLDSNKNEINLGKVLFEAEMDPEKDFPYREVHWEKVPGRWLGVGMVEKNFDGQIRMNELQNLKSKALYLTSRVLLQSEDDTIAKNILTDLGNGDILRVKSPITQIPMVQQEMGAFNQEEQRWDKNIQESSFTFETETGESMPSGTPFRLGALQKAASGGFFNFKREKVGLFWRDLFFEAIIPTFKKSKRKKHPLTIPKDDKEIPPLVEKYVDFYIYTKAQEALEKTGFTPTMEQIAQERARILARYQSGKGYFFEVPDSFYDEAQFSMDLVVTDEQIDLGQKLETISTLIQLIGSNPAILEDPRLKAMIYATMSLAGVSPIEIGLDQVNQQTPALPQPGQQPQMQGPPQQPVPQQVQGNVVQ
jgi:hypothetical protein